MLPEALDWLQAWFPDEPCTVQPTERGSVNTTYWVQATRGSFVLKQYDAAVHLAQIHYEQALLQYLQQAELPFQVPAPVPTAFGATLVQVERSGQVLRLALLPFIAGEMIDRHNPQQVWAAGQALGQLHQALSGFDSAGTLAQLPAWGELHQLHPLMPDPFDLLPLLELDATQQHRLAKLLIEVLETSTQLYAELPMQTTHADYLCPNVLVQGQRVTGVLDFEFATRDLRLMDYVCGLDHFGGLPWTDSCHPELLQSFAAGYCQTIALTEAEQQAVASVWRLQRASCLVYWAGWMLEGKSTYGHVMRAVDHLLWLDDWLQQQGSTVLANLPVGLVRHCAQQPDA
jgi:homoserine kinase type II